MVGLIEILLLALDRRFDLRGWAPSLGANLLTMLVTLLVVERMLQKDATKKRHKLAASLLTKPITGMFAICHRVAEGLLKDEAEALRVIDRERPQWKEWAAAWPESVKYMTAELGPDLLQRIDTLEEQMMDMHRMRDRGHGPDFFLSFYAVTMLIAWEDLRKLTTLLAPGAEPYNYFIASAHPLMRALERKFDLPTHYDEQGKWKKSGAPLSWDKEKSAGK